MAPALISPAEIDYIVRGAAVDTRADGRARLDTRQITLETGVISHASGSARLRVHGGTDVLVGVKVEAGLPELVESDGSTLAKGDRGRLVLSVECSPSASQQFEGRGADELNNELTQVLTRVLCGPQGGIDLESLCIIPGKACWIIYIDALVLDYGGNLLDTTLLAARSALHNARVPVTIIQDLGDGSGAVDFEIDDDVENARRLKGWEDVPLGVTLCTMRLDHRQGEDEEREEDGEQQEDDGETAADGGGGRRKDNAPVGQLYLADCSPLEELSASARIFVAFNRQGRVVTVQKSGDGSLSPGLLVEIMQNAKIYVSSLIRRHDAALSREESADDAKRARAEPVRKLGFFS